MALPQEFLDIQGQVRNWGRWGDDDRIGTLNFLTDEVVRAAAAEVQSGKRISLGTPLEANGMQLGAIPGRVNAELTTFAVNMSLEDRPEAFHTSDDAVTMGLQAGTHWDGLAHVSYDDVVYGGRPASIITEEAGAGDIGIENVRSICGRGVLLDVARALGVDELDFGYAITAEDLDAAVAAQGTEIRSGDIALIRTGLMRRYHAGEKENYNGWSGSPGPGLSCVPWFHRHELAAVATDTFIFEVYPSELETAQLGVHMLDVVDMGLTQGQNWDLEELAADCAADGRYSFFLEASPQPFVGACGSPVNPVAIK